MTAPKVVTRVKTMAQANEVRLLCPHCNNAVYVPLQWPYLAFDRQRRIKEAMDEHRKLCSGAPQTEARVCRIDYPRAR